MLVTGAGGFIGSHLAEHMVGCGARVRALVNYRASGSWGWLDQSLLRTDMEVIAGDIRDSDYVERAAAGTDVVFHLAALIAIPYSYHAPSSFIETNVNGTLNVLRAARRSGAERIVQTSTSEVYGTARYVPMNEDHPLQAQSPYSASKIAADKLAESFWRSYGLPVVTVRPFNTFGPRQSTRAVIPAIITQCLAGDTVRLGNLHPVRDMNYVGDVVRGFERAGTAAAAIGRTINIGSGRGSTIADLVRVIAQATNSSVAIETDDARVRPENSEVGTLVADNTLARELLDWRPAVSLEEGLRLTIEWMKDHLSEYRPGVYQV